MRTPDQLARMRNACRAAAQVLEHTGRFVRAGVTTDELDGIAHEAIIQRGAYPSPSATSGSRSRSAPR